MRIELTSDWGWLPKSKTLSSCCNLKQKKSSNLTTSLINGVKMNRGWSGYSGSIIDTELHSLALIACFKSYPTRARSYTKNFPLELTLRWSGLWSALIGSLIFYKPIRVLKTNLVLFSLQDNTHAQSVKLSLNL